MTFGIGYDDDIKQAKNIIEQVLKDDGCVLDEPTPTIGVAELADSSVNFAVRPWCKAADYWDVFFNVQENVKKRLDKEEISIPFPQRDIHIVSQPNGE